MLIHPNFDPVAIAIGPIAVRWYGLMYLAAFGFLWWLGRKRIAQGLAPVTREQFDDLIFYGVVGTKPGHILFSTAGAEQRAYPPEHLRVPNYDDLFVDVGARSAEEAGEMGVRPGLEMTYDRDLRWLGDGRHGLVTGRALDDRVGCLALLETMRMLREAGQRPRADVSFTFCTQEEIGLRGAQVAGAYVQPDICIGVDGTISASGFGVGATPAPGPTISSPSPLSSRSPPATVTPPRKSWP